MRRSWTRSGEMTTLFALYGIDDEDRRRSRGSAAALRPRGSEEEADSKARKRRRGSRDAASLAQSCLVVVSPSAVDVRLATGRPFPRSPSLRPAAGLLAGMLTGTMACARRRARHSVRRPRLGRPGRRRDASPVESCSSASRGGETLDEPPSVADGDPRAGCGRARAGAHRSARRGRAWMSCSSPRCCARVSPRCAPGPR